MSASATFLIYPAERVPRWSSTRHASARPDAWPTLLLALHSTQRPMVVGAPAKPIGPTSKRNHPTAAPRRLTPTPIAELKPP